MCDEYIVLARELKLDVMAAWIEAEWLPRHPDQDWLMLITNVNCANDARGRIGAIQTS